MGYPSDPNQEAVDRLMKKHGLNSGAVYYDQYDLQTVMNFAAFRYELMSKLKYDTGKVKKQTKILAKKAKNLVKAIDGFNEALHGFDDLSENPAGLIPVRDVEIQKKQVRTDAQSWAYAADKAYEEFEAMGTLKNNIGDPAFTFLLKNLIQIYEEGTGRKARRSVNPHKGQYIGPFFRFIEDCLDQIGVPTKSNKALGSAIERHLKERKSQTRLPIF